MAQTLLTLDKYTSLKSRQKTHKLRRMLSNNHQQLARTVENLHMLAIGLDWPYRYIVLGGDKLAHELVNEL